MNKRNSILFQITIFFAIVFLLINTLVIIQFFLDNHYNKTLHFKRYINATKTLLDIRFEKLTNEEINKKISPFNLEISKIKIRTLRKHGTRKIDDKFNPLEIFIYKNKKFIHIKPPMPGPGPEPGRKRNEFKKMPRDGLKIKPIVFIDLLDKNHFKYFWLGILLIIDILLVWFYYFILKKLKPLIKLKNEISKFSDGNLDINTKLEGKDEIAQVSNEFNNAIEKIRDLNDSRKLFLRNILHELKTPITKGKLVSDTLEDSKKKQILQRAFLRLEFLLEEFVKLELLSSGKVNLVKKEYRVIDLLDQALDLLLIDKSKVDIFPSNTKINVDFEVFSIALKNLIDNALKYNTNGNPEIYIQGNSLIIKNKGKALKKDFKKYLKPFNREYESIDKGLGLGLYITNSVIESHGFKLDYSYKDNYHIFKIDFS